MHRRMILLIGVTVGALLLAFWLAGAFESLQALILQAQRDTQNQLAGAVRAIRGNQPGALTGLLMLCFAYGFLHAAGPGHGKLVIGGYGMARAVPLVRLAGLALTAAMAQAGIAVALVYAVVALLGFGRERAEGLAEEVMAPLGLAMVAGVGIWLMWRGVHGLRHGKVPTHAHGHGHDHANTHGHDQTCTHCGHAHGPSLEDVSGLSGWRDSAALILGIAIRPCSGALFLLILTWQLGIAAAGIAGAFAMGLGTAVVTIAVAMLAVFARGATLASLPAAAAARALPVIELLAGALVALAAISLLTTSL